MTARQIVSEIRQLELLRQKVEKAHRRRMESDNKLIDKQIASIRKRCPHRKIERIKSPQHNHKCLTCGWLFYQFELPKDA